MELCVKLFDLSVLVRGLVHGLRLGQLSDFIGLKVTFSL